MPRRCTCDRTGRDAPYKPGDCVLCWQYHNDPKYRRHWDGPGRAGRAPAGRAGAAPRPARPPCVHEGPVVTSCPFGNELLHVRHCLHPTADWDTCSRGHARAADRSCDGCPLRDALVPEVVTGPSPQPDGWPVRLDERNCWPGAPGLRFNSSILADGDGCLFAYRNGWRGSEIFVGRLDAAFRPVGGPTRLHLHHPRDAGYGREDVRLFRHKGRPHVSFIGVVGGKRIRHTNQLFARLSEDGLRAEDVFSPVDYPAGRAREPRPRWQKNWQWFDVADHLFAVYTVRPHTVLRVAGSAATPAYETAGLPWAGGDPRGGAAPVRVGDEFWSFAHDRVHGPDGKLQYRTLLYTFDAAPPFMARRVVPTPILEADPTTRPPDQYASVVFAGGAVRVGDDWVIAHGVHDRWSELHRFAHADLEARLVDVLPRAVNEHLAGDVLLAALLIGGRDEFESGGKVRGTPCTTADLSPAELATYIRPFAESCRRWGVRGVVLHDGAPAELVAAHPWLTFSRVNPAGTGNFDRRWFAWRDWLAANAVGRVWCVDVNDVLFTAHPFAWLDGLPAGHVAAAVEPKAYRDNPWFADHLPHLPPAYAESLLGRHADQPAVNCGAWAADRMTALAVCRAVCEDLVAAECWLGDRPPSHAVCRDMAAFGRVLLDDFGARLLPVPAGGPLVHDLPRVRALLAAGG